MTLQQAYSLLRERWPRRSFCITRETWCHDHSADTGSPATRTDEWAIWDNEARVHYYGPTLENAMEQALGCDADLTNKETV